MSAIKIYSNDSLGIVLWDHRPGGDLPTCQMLRAVLSLALSKLHQHKLQVCENNWIRKIAGVRRVERRRMKDMLEEVVTTARIERQNS